MNTDIFREIIVAELSKFPEENHPPQLEVFAYRILATVIEATYAKAPEPKKSTKKEKKSYKLRGANAGYDATCQGCNEVFKAKGRAVYCKKNSCQKIRKDRKREKKLNYMKEYNAAPKVEQKDEAADIDKLIA